MSEAHRYLFLVRQPFGEVPHIDSFYKVGVPEGVTKDQALIMEKLSGDGFYKKEISEDSAALQGMELRVRFNGDMFQKVCLVNSEVEITAVDLDMIIESHYKNKTLGEFLAGAGV